jgi:protein-arginine kinase activator protein McsA
MKIGGIPPLQKLARYKLELAEAVKKEEYEKAARLRDRIQDLKQRIAWPADKANRSSGLA